MEIYIHEVTVFPDLTAVIALPVRDDIISESAAQ
jgi:hypothetical protein